MAATRDDDLFVIKRALARLKVVKSHPLLKGGGYARLNAFAKDTACVQTWSDLPDERLFESLVAIVRPFTLSGDVVFYEAILSGVTSLSDGDDGVDFLIRLFRSDWEAAVIRVKDDSPHGLEKALSKGTVSMIAVGIEGTDTWTKASESELAYRWLYEDVVHVEKPKRPELEIIPDYFKYRAAVSFFSKQAVLCVRTCTWLNLLVKQGRLGKPACMFERDYEQPDCWGPRVGYMPE